MFDAILGQNAYDIITEQIIICYALHNGWSSLHHVIYGYDDAAEKSMSDYDIHRTKMKCYYIAKSLRHRLNSAPPIVNNAPYCFRETVKEMK